MKLSGTRLRTISLKIQTQYQFFHSSKSILREGEEKRKPEYVLVGDCFAHARVLKRCVFSGNTLVGRAIHCNSIKLPSYLDLFALNILLDIYVKSDLMSDAFKLFDEMTHWNTVSYVTLVQGCIKYGMFDEACHLFLRLHREGHELTTFVFTVIMKLFVNMESPELCRCIHSCVFKLGHTLNTYVGTVLIDAYSLCGQVDNAKAVFDGIYAKDNVCWTGMVSCYVENGFSREAICIFSEMMRIGLDSNNFIISSILKSAVALDDLALGKTIHACSIKTNYETNHYVSGSLIDMYAKCGDIEDSRIVFDSLQHCNTLLWGFMIARYVQVFQNEEALEIFKRMRHASVMPNQFSICSVLQACAGTERKGLGEQVHCIMIKIGFDCDTFVANALMDFYTKCNLMDSSIDVFSRLQDKDEVSWNIIISSYVQLGFGEDALIVFRQMHSAQVEITRVTYSSSLRACASLAMLEQTSQIHSSIAKSVFNNDMIISNGLIDAYAKCGLIKNSRKIFDSMTKHDDVTWNSMISGYSLHGLCLDALDLFDKMCRTDTNTRPDRMTFIGVLSACSNIGFVNEGKYHFRRMIEYYKIKPSMEHYACMVKLLGRSGNLDEAMQFIDEMPSQPDVLVWRALLGACFVHKNTIIGEVCADRVLEIDPLDGSSHVLLANTYASTQNWEKMAFVRKLMRSKGVNKEPGLSWIETQDEFHKFSAGDMSHPNIRIIKSMLESLRRMIHENGYNAIGDAVLHVIDDDQKEKSLWMHSERLTLAFGLTIIRRDRPIRIIKNLRFCSDCHAVFKVISRIIQREFIVRDKNRFHNFMDGICSCGDFW